MKDRAPRYDITLEVRLIPENSNGRFHGVSQNISETGILVLAERTEPRGTMARVEFSKFTGTGEVIGTRDTEEEFLIGMRFVSLSRGRLETLTQLLTGPGTEG